MCRIRSSVVKQNGPQVKMWLESIRAADLFCIIFYIITCRYMWLSIPNISMYISNSKFRTRFVTIYATDTSINVTQLISLHVQVGRRRTLIFPSRAIMAPSLHVAVESWWTVPGELQLAVRPASTHIRSGMGGWLRGASGRETGSIGLRPQSQVRAGC